MALIRSTFSLSEPLRNLDSEASRGVETRQKRLEGRALSEKLMCTDVAGSLYCGDSEETCPMRMPHTHTQPRTPKDRWAHGAIRLEEVRGRELAVAWDFFLESHNLNRVQTLVFFFLFY